MFSTSELIVAAATPEGAGTRAIVRLAGDGLERVLARLVDPDGPGFPTAGEGPRLVAARLATHGIGGAWGLLPVEVLAWPGPGGPIGGPLAEVQLPACVPLVSAFVARACQFGCREARGGEFTLRAFLSGRLDLVAAEAVVAVTDARSPAELSAALDRMGGGAGQALEAVRGDLLDLLADIEAAIDFADETTPDSVPSGPDWSHVHDRIMATSAAIRGVARHLAARDSAAADLPMVVLAGPPNIGKSSLLNALVGRDAALVADEQGTTRDWLEALLADADGPRCLLVDVAGLEGSRVVGTVDGIGAAAAARARDAIARADLVITCRDALSGEPSPPLERRSIAVVTRCDRGSGQPVSDEIATSSRTGEGVARLRDAIVHAVASLSRSRSPASRRLVIGCDQACAALSDAVEAAREAAAGQVVDESLVAGNLRRATDALAEVTGAIVDTDLLDRIFSRHCIGK